MKITHLLELNIIKILHSLPYNSFQKTESLRYLNRYEEKASADLDIRQSRQGGSNAKNGYCVTKVNVSHWYRTFRAFYKHSEAKKKWLVQR